MDGTEVPYCTINVALESCLHGTINYAPDVLKGCAYSAVIIGLELSCALQTSLVAVTPVILIHWDTPSITSIGCAS